MEFITTLHSIIRWVVVIMAVAVLVRSGLGWLGKVPYTKMDRGLMAGLAGSIDLQVLLGLIVFFGLGADFKNQIRMEHAFTMLIVMVLGHLPMRWRGSSDAKRKFRNNFITVVVIALLVYAGVMRVGGW